MRKSKERPHFSPKFKLAPRNPSSPPKLKIASPAHSARPRSKNNNRFALTTPNSQPNILWLPSPAILGFVEPLAKLCSPPLHCTPTLSTQDRGGEVWVISAIDCFIDAYM
jgi:hypothetical protein